MREASSEGRDIQPPESSRCGSHPFAPLAAQPVSVMPLRWNPKPNRTSFSN